MYYYIHVLLLYILTHMYTCVCMHAYINRGGSVWIEKTVAVSCI